MPVPRHKRYIGAMLAFSLHGLLHFIFSDAFHIISTNLRCFDIYYRHARVANYS